MWYLLFLHETERNIIVIRWNKKYACRVVFLSIRVTWGEYENETNRFIKAETKRFDNINN